MKLLLRLHLRNCKIMLFTKLLFRVGVGSRMGRSVKDRVSVLQD